MSSFFSTPKVPSVTATTAAPAITDTTAAQDNEQDRLNRRKGLTSTIAAGDAATVQSSNVATKALLGS